MYTALLIRYDLLSLPVSVLVFLVASYVYTVLTLAGQRRTLAIYMTASVVLLCLFDILFTLHFLHYPETFAFQFFKIKLLWLIFRIFYIVFYAKKVIIYVAKMFEVYKATVARRSINYH